MEKITFLSFIPGTTTDKRARRIFLLFVGIRVGPLALAAGNLIITVTILLGLHWVTCLAKRNIALICLLVELVQYH